MRLETCSYRRHAGSVFVIDPNQRAEIRRLITELGKERTVLLSTHVLSEVEHTCARLLIINGGRLVADGPVETLVRRAQGAAEVYVEVMGDGVLDALRSLRGVVSATPTTVEPWGARSRAEPMKIGRVTDGNGRKGES